MSMIRKLGLVAALGAALVVTGCAGEKEFTSMGGRVDQLEQEVAALGKRPAAMAAGDGQAAERAAKAAEEARLAADQARRASETAAQSSARVEEMFRRSLRK